MTQLRKNQKQRDRRAAREGESQQEEAVHPWAPPPGAAAESAAAKPEEPPPKEEPLVPVRSALAEAEEKYLEADARLQQGIAILQSRLSPENNPDSHAREDRGLRDESHRIEAFLFKAELDKLRGA